MPDAPPNPAPPLLELPSVARILSDPTRWRILKVMVESTAPLMVVELAERVGCSPDSMSKHLAILRDAGLVTTGRNRLNELRPHFITDRAEGLLDLGYCLVRLKAV